MKNSYNNVVTQGAAIASTVAGQIVAFVPSLRPDESILISISGIVLSGLILLSDALKTQHVITHNGVAVTSNTRGLGQRIVTAVHTIANDVEQDTAPKQNPQSPIPPIQA